MVAKIKSGMVLPIASRAKAVQEAFREASTEVWYRCSGRRVIVTADLPSWDLQLHFLQQLVSGVTVLYCRRIALSPCQL